MDPLHKKHVGAIGREYVPSLYWGRLCGRKARGTSSWTIASSPVQIIEVCRHHVKFVLQMFNSAGGLNVFTSKLSLQAPSQLNHKLKEFYMPYERSCGKLFRNCKCLATNILYSRQCARPSETICNAGAQTKGCSTLSEFNQCNNLHGTHGCHYFLTDPCNDSLPRGMQLKHTLLEMIKFREAFAGSDRPTQYGT